MRNERKTTSDSAQIGVGGRGVLGFLRKGLKVVDESTITWKQMQHRATPQRLWMKS